MPYLTQFSDRQRELGEGGQTALRHMYAAALAEMGSGPHQPGGDGQPEGEESQLPQHERKEEESRTASLEDSLDGTVAALQVRATAGTQYSTVGWPHYHAGVQPMIVYSSIQSMSCTVVYLLEAGPLW